MRLFDAHVHLQDPKIAQWLSQLLVELPQLGLKGSVVNGTNERDWDAVAELANRTDWILPSFGLHPWWVGTQSPDWLDRLERFILSYPNSGIGEIGLHRPRSGSKRHLKTKEQGLRASSIHEQTDVLVQQLELAARMNRVATLHCIHAWEEMSAILSTVALPRRGFLLHAYSGEASLIPLLLDRGAYFSFNGHHLGDSYDSRRAIFATLPSERLLVETDAPSLGMPASLIEFRFLGVGQNSPYFSHPANLVVTYRELARLRHTECSRLAHQLAENFAALFGEPDIRSFPVPRL